MLKHTCKMFFHLDAEEEFENKIYMCISHMEMTIIAITAG